MSHMDVNDRSSVSSQRQACSAENTTFQNFDHNMMNFGPLASQIQIPQMVKDAAEITVAMGPQRQGTNTLDVNVTVKNTKAGHNFPTDSPLRHLILVVTAVDRVNTPLIQAGRPTDPRLGRAGTYKSNHRCKQPNGCRDKRL